MSVEHTIAVIVFVLLVGALWFLLKGRDLWKALREL